MVHFVLFDALFEVSLRQKKKKSAEKYKVQAITLAKCQAILESCQFAPVSHTFLPASEAVHHSNGPIGKCVASRHQ